MTTTNNNARAAATRKAAAHLNSSPAKNKNGNAVLSKAELARRADERALTLAQKEVDKKTYEQIRNDFVTGVIKADSFTLSFALALNKRFAKTIAEYREHWSVIVNSDNNKHPSSNLHPVWKEIKAELADIAHILTYGCVVGGEPVKGWKRHSNASQAVGRVVERAFAVAYPGQKRPPRVVKLPAENAVDRLVAAYKAVAKETMQTPRDEQLVSIIGEAIVRAGLDLATINKKLNI